MKAKDAKKKKKKTMLWGEFRKKLGLFIYYIYIYIYILLGHMWNLLEHMLL